VTTGIVSNCFFCGTTGPQGTGCPSCLVPIPRLTPDATASYACPRCAHARGCTTPLLALGIAPSATIHACPTCHGILVGARAWCTLVARPELAPAIAAKLPARAAPASELVRLLKCPACSREMERGRFGASSNIVIDVCLTHGIWLDSGEVVAVADHAALRARVGVNAARRASEATDWQGYDPTRAAVEAEAAMRTAVARSRKKQATGAGFFLLLLFLAVRLWFTFGRHSTGAPPEINAAGQSAASAATELGNH
jgi:Zn-finger nucleic acid-binding protein